jgi:Xaa-Pro aminopeptidase
VPWPFDEFIQAADLRKWMDVTMDRDAPPSGLTLQRPRDGREYREDQAVKGHQMAPVDRSLIERYESIDRRSLRAYRLERIRAPLNIRYATDTNNLGLWVMHSPSRYVYIATDGPVILFDFVSSRHNSEGIETIDEIRPAIPWLYFLAGPRVEEKATLWAREVADLVATYGAGNRRLAVDRCDPWGAERLKAHGIELFDAQPLSEQARLIKSLEEIAQHEVSMAVCDLGISRMVESLHAGVTENQLWSILHETNVAHGGEWAESRLLNSGPRTNPWFQDATNRVIEAGDMVCFDTDMVGPGGYLSDISRSFVCPGRGRPDHAQRRSASRGTFIPRIRRAMLASSGALRT